MSLNYFNKFMPAIRYYLLLLDICKIVIKKRNNKSQGAINYLSLG